MNEAPPGFIPVGDGHIINVRSIDSVTEHPTKRFPNNEPQFTTFGTPILIETGEKHVKVVVGDLTVIFYRCSLIQFMAKMQRALEETA